MSDASGTGFGYGPEQCDSISGWLFPTQVMVKQCGGLISSRWADGSLDLKRYKREEECPPSPGSLNAPPLPVVGIKATTPNAAKTGPVDGVFTFTNFAFSASPAVQNDYLKLCGAASFVAAVTIFYTIGGTAVNGTDYATIPSSIVIPANTASAVLSIDPLGGGGPMTTVVLTITPDPTYTVGYLGQDTVTIAP